MRREILKRGRVTVRADAQNQGTEEAAADTARGIYAAGGYERRNFIATRVASTHYRAECTDRLGTLSRRAVRIVPRHCRRIGIATDIVSAMRRAHSKDSACGTARMRKRGEILKFARPDP